MIVRAKLSDSPHGNDYSNDKAQKRLQVPTLAQLCHYGTVTAEYSIALFLPTCYMDTHYLSCILYRLIVFPTSLST